MANTPLDLDVHRLWVEESMDDDSVRVTMHIPFCMRYTLTETGRFQEDRKHVLTRNDQRVTCKKCIKQAGIKIKDAA